MNKQNARDRILQAAVQVFAEKSYEGSRIEEIANAAGVPKSLIYYHFKSKEEILEVLTRDFFDAYMALIETAAQESHRERAEALPGRMRDIYYEFGMRNKDLVRIILIESLKKTEERPVLFKIVEALIDKEPKRGPGYDVEERRVAEFFTSLIPIYAYLCFGDAWTRYFGLDRERFDALFLTVYRETHGAYHARHQ